MRWVLMEAIMRAWILAAAAALAVGQAEAVTITYSTGPLYLTDSCLALPNNTCATGDPQTWDVYGVVEWSVDLLIDDAKVVWSNGVGLASDSAIRLTALRTNFDTRGWISRNIANVSVVDMRASLGADMSIISMLLLSEYHWIDKTWYFDTTNGQNRALLWAEQTRGRDPRHYVFNDTDLPIRVSPVPLPATAPLMGAALIGLGLFRRRRS